MSIHASRTCTTILACLASVAVFGCADQGGPTDVNARPSLSTVRASQAFTVGPLAISGIAFQFPGPNLHLRDVQLSGAVTGSLTGTMTIALDADLDGSGTGPTSGKVTIVTAEGEWRGNLVGSFLGDFPTGILLSSQVVLHGPGQQLLTAECDEIPPSSSETLACSGEVQAPGN